MKTNRIKDKKEYEEVMKTIEKLLQKTSKKNTKDITPEELAILKKLSLMAEKYEDNIPLMPLKTPATIVEMIKYKMFELNIKQNQLAKILEISETRISELLKGKRKINLEVAKKLHTKLHIDAHFILKVA